MITSLTNPKIKEIAKLTKKKYIDKYNMTLIYNDKVIDEAIKTNNLVCLITNKQVSSDIPNLLVSDEVLIKLHPHHQLADVAIIKTKEAKPLSTKQVLVLDEIKDPGNMGSILRSAFSFGIKDVVITPGCVDINSHKVIVASAGSIFYLNIIKQDLITYLNKSEFPIITTFLDEEHNTQKEVSEFNLVIGNEQVGIKEEVKELVHTNYKIETKFESLNVSVATGIIIYNLLKG